MSKIKVLMPERLLKEFIDAFGLYDRVVYLKDSEGNILRVVING